MGTAIKVENLSKIYRLGEIGTGTISRDIERFVKTKILKQDDPFLKIGEANDRATKGASDIVYSLKDINFEIEQGDAVGIIGRNGAGKSTLLKILSRITSPTTGKINIKGRVASLLEVGTGFHPELTGRENIYLNGSILGMRKREIDRKLDEIIDFSGVERYIDTPVKRYSSGMYVRLAFAVAAHLDSEILIVDEVLAVGDAEFQKKCLGKMGEISKGEGRTVLFVSHNLGSISHLCSESMFLQNGTVLNFGKTETILNEYINGTTIEQLIIKDIYREDENYFQDFFMCDENLEHKEEFRYDEEIFIKIKLKTNNSMRSLELAMRLIDNYKRAVFTIHHNISEIESCLDIKDLLISIPKNFLTPNLYSWVICINHPGYRSYDLHEDIISFKIIETGSSFARYEGLEYGNVVAKYLIKKL